VNDATARRELPRGQPDPLGECLPAGASAARILVVDDEYGVREGCRKILSEEGYEAFTAEDGVEGLARFEENPGISVVLVDMMMPRMGGLELLRRIRERTSDVVVIIITAHATIDSAVEGTKQGAYSYIPKPFTPDELLLTIRNGLERQALAAESRRLREERERRLLELESERSRSNTIIKCMTDGVLVINLEKLVVLRNAAAARILPGSAARPLPFPLPELESPGVRELIAEVLDGPGTPQILSREILLGTQTYMLNVSPVPEQNGQTSAAVAVFRDITELKKLEVAKSMFVSMVAHEVKNPLAATEGWLNLLLSGMMKKDPAEERHVLERSLLRVRTLRTLVSELLNLTAIETGNFTLRRSPVDVPSVVREAIEACREKAAEKRLALGLNGARVDGPGTGRPGAEGAAPDRPYPDGGAAVAAAAGAPAALAPLVLADRDALLIILTNLIDNAVKYTPDGGRISVSVSGNDAYLTVRVRDTGFGLSPEEGERVFDEFYRVKNEHTADIPGTGLGLSLVKRLTELHQGRIEVTSIPGEGSVFTLSLPLH
jgi:two-component system phosphate regulon sensor histidine kinase PhoR